MADLSEIQLTGSADTRTKLKKLLLTLIERLGDEEVEMATVAYVDGQATAQVDADATMAANSDALVASQKATKTALATKPTATLSTNTALGTSDTTVSSQKAVKAYIDAAIAAEVTRANAAYAPA